MGKSKKLNEKAMLDAISADAILSLLAIHDKSEFEGTVFAAVRAHAEVHGGSALETFTRLLRCEVKDL